MAKKPALVNSEKELKRYLHMRFIILQRGIQPATHTHTLTHHGKLYTQYLWLRRSFPKSETITTLEMSSRISQLRVREYKKFEQKAFITKTLEHKVSKVLFFFFSKLESFVDIYKVGRV